MSTIVIREKEEDKTPTKSLIENLKKASSAGEKLKSWGALLLGVAAIVTAFSTWKDPSKEAKVSNAIYTELSTEMKELSKDIKSVANDVEYLYRLKEQEEKKARENSELLKSHEKIEETYLKQYLTTKYGPRYAREFIERKKKLQDELRLDVVTAPNREPTEIRTDRMMKDFKSVQEKALKK